MKYKQDTNPSNKTPKHNAISTEKYFEKGSFAMNLLVFKRQKTSGRVITDMSRRMVKICQAIWWS